MKKIMQHVLNKTEKKVKIDESSLAEKDSAGPLAAHPIPSLARMSANLSRKSIGALSTSSEAPKVQSGCSTMFCCG